MDNRKILATDFDGTLNRGGISEKDRGAIKAFRASGNLFGVVTGRDIYMYNTLVHENLDVDFVIALNGTIIIDGNGHIVHETKGDSRCIRGIAEILGGYGKYLSCVVHDTRYNFHAAYADGNDKYSPLAKTDELDHFSMLNSVVDTLEQAAECVNKINSEYGEYVNALQNGICIDIPPRGIDKGVGVARYAEMMGVKAENIRCAGDELNDLAMIERFYGCAVTNARDRVKSAARGVFEGIWEIIEKW